MNNLLCTKYLSVRTNTRFTVDIISLCTNVFNFVCVFQICVSWPYILLTYPLELCHKTSQDWMQHKEKICPNKNNHLPRLSF